MTRDRLADLKESRGDGDSKNLYHVSVTVDFKDEFMADFFAQAEDIQDSIDKIKKNVEEVKKKHKSILCTPGTEENEKQELENLMADIKKMANQVRMKLKALESGNEQQQQKSGSSASMRIRSTQCSALLRTFVEVMTDYNQAQLHYREQNKDRIRRHLEITGRSTTDEELEGLLESGNVAVFTQGIIMDMQQAKETVALIEARHSDILKLEKNIRELHDMFMDVAMLVENQGEMIDRIEYHVQNATGYTDNAVVQTRQASSYKVKARKKKILIIICLGVVVGLLVLIIVLAWKLK